MKETARAQELYTHITRRHAGQTLSMWLRGYTLIQCTCLSKRHFMDFEDSFFEEENVTKKKPKPENYQQYSPKKCGAEVCGMKVVLQKCSTCNVNVQRIRRLLSVLWKTHIFWNCIISSSVTNELKRVKLKVTVVRRTVTIYYKANYCGVGQDNYSRSNVEVDWP